MASHLQPACTLIATEELYGEKQLLLIFKENAKSNNTVHHSNFIAQTSTSEWIRFQVDCSAQLCRFWIPKMTLSMSS